MSLEQRLQQISTDMRVTMDIRDAYREKALRTSRELIRGASVTIKHLHRLEWEQADVELQNAQAIAAQLIRLKTECPEIYYAGYTQDGLKELWEATLFSCMIRAQEMPSERMLGAEPPAYLNGLAEAASECRRQILDMLRAKNYADAERLMGIMDEVYLFCTGFDYTDALTGGLRRTVDALRAVIERTRGDLTITCIQAELERTIREKQA
ncbi:MAG: haloacid dehalogenase [Armatimonadota bacterium]